MIAYSSTNSLLLMQFRQFVDEMVRLKHRVVGPPAGALPADDVRNALLTLLNGQSERLSETGGSLGYGLYREMQYVMAALADETFLNADWADRKNWQLLEQHLFDSHDSGERFFQKLQKLLDNPSFSSDLGMVYFYALSLDFQGKYRGYDPRNQLTLLRQDLFYRLYAIRARDLTVESIFAGTCARPTVDDVERRLPSPHLWWYVIAGVLVLWLATSSLLWLRIAAPIQQKLEETNRTLPAQERVQPTRPGVVR